LENLEKTQRKKENIENKNNELKKIIDNYKKSIADIEKEIKTNMASNESTKTQDSIMQKNKEYSDYIESFDDNKRNKMKEIQNKEELIVALLENISEKLVSKTNLPSQSQYKELIADRDNKRKIIDKSKMTLDEAKVLYDDLQVKIKRIDNLEENLKKEITNMNEKMEIMKKEIGEKYEKVEVEKDFYTKEVKKFNDLIKYILRESKQVIIKS